MVFVLSLFSSGKGYRVQVFPLNPLYLIEFSNTSKSDGFVKSPFLTAASQGMQTKPYTISQYFDSPNALEQLAVKNSSLSDESIN